MPELPAARCAPLIHARPWLEALPPATRFILRGGPAVATAAGPAFGSDIPQQPCRASTASDRAALWLGPDEWLLIAPTSIAGDCVRTLSAALAGLPHSLVEVSHRQCGLKIQGGHAPQLLAAGCPLDLAASAFPVGMCTRTVLAKAEVVLWRTDADVFRLEVWRSFAAYVAAFLGEAARGSI